MAKKRQRGLAKFSMSRLQANRLFHPQHTFSGNEEHDSLVRQRKAAKLAVMEEEAVFKRTQLGRRAYIVFSLIFFIMWLVPSAMLS